MKSVQREKLPELPVIDEVVPWSPLDQALFDELREVLKRHGAASRFGIALLHRHFDVADDEMLIETCDTATRTLTSRPRNRKELDGENVVETSWRLDALGAMQVCQGSCVTSPFGHQPGGHRGARATDSTATSQGASSSRTE